MHTFGGVLFANSGQGIFLKIRSQPNKSRPQATVDIGNLAVDQTAHEDILTASYQARGLKNFLTVRMRPPVSVNGTSGYSLRQIWNGPLSTFQNDSMLTNKANSVDVHANTIRRNGP